MSDINEPQILQDIVNEDIDAEGKIVNSLTPEAQNLVLRLVRMELADNEARLKLEIISYLRQKGKEKKIKPNKLMRMKFREKDFLNIKGCALAEQALEDKPKRINWFKRLFKKNS